MNNKPLHQSKKDAELKSNIKIRPNEHAFKTLSGNEKTVGSNLYYYITWLGVAVVSVSSLWAIIAQEGGVDDAIKTANFNKLNRQVANNELVTTDTLPTASIPKSAIRITKDDVPTQPLDFNPYVKEEAKNSSSVIGTTYFAALLAQGDSKPEILDLWYQTKRKNPELFKNHSASYYLDTNSNTYNLVIGKFTDLNKTLQFCATLKFNDIACKYDQKFINLSTIKID